MSVSVITAPLLDPGQGRFEVTIPEGLSLLDMVQHSLPGLPVVGRDCVRVSLVTPKGVTVINARYWHCTRPRDGVQVIIRVVPGKDALRAVLTIVISVAALYFAPAIAGFFGITGALGISLVAAGLNIIGMMLLNALIPLPTPDDQSSKNTYSISGLQNQLRRDEPLPLVLGRHRFSPPYGAMSYTEVVGDQQFVRALFCFGYGRLALEDFKIGDTSLADYDDVDIEVREGVAGDLPLSIFPNQVLEEATNVELTRPFPRDDTGELVSGGVSIETPIRRYTAVDTETAAVIIGFPSGLFRVDGDGNLRFESVEIRIRQRLVDAIDWQDVTTLNISAKNRSAFFRQHIWTLPTRGRWQIEVTRMKSESTSTSVSDRSTLSAIQSVRPEYPINMDKPLALVALRIRATHQLNGALNNFNAVVTRYAPEWDGAAWADSQTRNPASAYLQALTGPSNPYPVAAAEIDYDLIADWHEFCALKNLKYDFVHGSGETLSDMLQKICVAGRATWRNDGLKWGVVIDRPDDLVIDHINPRNSADFTWSRQYFDPPHAFRIKFADETNDYQEAERIVPWPGYTGDITLTETLNLPGKTDPDEIWIETRRRMYELLHRSDTYTAIQDGAVRVTTRGDTVMGSFDVLSRSQVAARVQQVDGLLIVLDETVTIEADVDYAIRFRVFADPDDTIGTSVVRDVNGQIGARASLLMTSADPVPQVGDLVHFGEKATESIALKIKGVEAGENFSSILNMVAAAPEIDTLTDADIPPTWDGRVGAEIALAVINPPAPRFTSILTGIDGTGNVDAIQVLLETGSGSSALISEFKIQHRLLGASIWSEILIPVADGGALILDHLDGDEVELRALSVAVGGLEGPYTPTISVIIGAAAALIPQQLDDGTIIVIGGLGSTEISVAIPETNAPDQIQVYRVPSGDALNREIHAAGAPLPVTPATTATYTDGDNTPATLIDNGDFSVVSSWVADPNWVISGGKANHTAGVADNIQQAEAFVSGDYYRIALTVTGRTAGSVTPRLSGGSDRDGTAVSDDGLALDRIQAVTGNDTFALVASSDFDGAIDDVVVFEETETSLSAGLFDYYIEPQTVEGVPGPVSGPFLTQIL